MMVFSYISVFLKSVNTSLGEDLKKIVRECGLKLCNLAGGLILVVFGYFLGAGVMSLNMHISNQLLAIPWVSGHGPFKTE